MKRTRPNEDDFTTKQLSYMVYNYCRARGFYFVLPEMGYEGFVADFLAYTPGKKLMEIEIKKSYSDYLNDRKKRTYLFQEHKPNHFVPCQKKIYKYDFLTTYKGNCRWKPEFFVYCAPEIIAQKIKNDSNLPKAFGILAVSDGGNVFSIKNKKRLCTLTEAQSKTFEQDACYRALYFMDKYYEFNEA